MAKKTINELELKKQPLSDIPDEIPDEFTPSRPPQYPGTYTLRLPADLHALWDKIDLYEDGKVVGERVVIIFDDEDPLVIQASPGGASNGEGLVARITNKERNRAKKGEPPVLVSDMTYLLRALKSTAKLKNGDNDGFIKELCKHAGASFKADQEWTANCNEERQVYVEVVDESTGATTLQPGVDDNDTPVMGCGERYYMNDWPRGADGKYRPRLICKCGAALRPFGSLRNFKAVS